MQWQTNINKSGRLARIFSWRRLAVAVSGTLVLWSVLLPLWIGSQIAVVGQTTAAATLGLVVFGCLESWPAQLPRWLPRWLLQTIGLALAIPALLWIVYVALTPNDQPYFWYSHSRRVAFVVLTCSCLLFAIVLALYAVVHRREVDARSQAFAFELERSEHARQSLDARMGLLQAQIQPHFLFNTLANIRGLVEAGAPQAIAVLDSMIDYLQAAVPRLHGSEATLGQEAQLVRAYLELMQMRFPDRLSFEIRIDESAKAVRCPPATLLTLVENSVRHGIDPSEDGGRIEVDVHLRANRCWAAVTDTGVGIQAAGHGLGTGLTTLRERLTLAFNGDANLRVESVQPHGVCAQLDFPARAAES